MISVVFIACKAQLMKIAICGFELNRNDTAKSTILLYMGSVLIERVGTPVRISVTFCGFGLETLHHLHF